MLYDIIIIGAGTAGMTAALYAKRAGKSVMILEAESFGGQISHTPRVENYPGIKQISGEEFSSSLFDQITELGTEFDLVKVDKVAVEGKYKTVYAEDKEYRAKAVIIAVGVKHRKLNLPREDELLGEGVCYCAVCDGAFYKGLPVAVAGGGNSALTEALFLSSYCSTVHLIQLMPEFSAEKILIDRVISRENIIPLFNSSITRLIGENSLDGLEILNTKENKTSGLNVSALFVSIGQAPDNDAFSNVVKLDKSGFIDAEDCQTKTDGVFAAGDCRTKPLRQLTTAVADGALSAILACKYCDSLD